MSTLDNGLKAEWLRLTAENARLRETLARIERGATSGLLDAEMKDEPIHRDVLLEIVKDVRAALSNGERK